MKASDGPHLVRVTRGGPFFRTILPRLLDSAMIETVSLPIRQHAAKSTGLHSVRSRTGRRDGHSRPLPGRLRVWRGIAHRPPGWGNRSGPGHHWSGRQTLSASNTPLISPHTLQSDLTEPDPRSPNPP